MSELQSPGTIMAGIRKEYMNEVQKGAGFDVSRGLLRGTNPKTEGYLDYLPTFDKKNFIQLVDSEIEKRKQQEIKDSSPYQKVRIVDVGYGQGRFLLDCFKKWGNDIELIGYGNDSFTKANVTARDGSKLPPTEEMMQEADIKLVVGNIVDIRKLLGDKSADFLVCSNVMQWVGYPYWEMIKKFYRVLGESGVALIDSKNIDTQNGDRQDLLTYLTKMGYHFEFGDTQVAFRKTKSDILLPIRSIGSAYRDSVKYPQEQDRPVEPELHSDANYTPLDKKPLKDLKQ